MIGSLASLNALRDVDHQSNKNTPNSAKSAQLSIKAKESDLEVNGTIYRYSFLTPIVQWLVWPRIVLQTYNCLLALRPYNLVIYSRKNNNFSNLDSKFLKDYYEICNYLNAFHVMSELRTHESASSIGSIYMKPNIIFLAWKQMIEITYVTAVEEYSVII